MKKKFAVFFAALCFANLPLWADADFDLLKKADALASYLDTDFSAEYTFVQEKPGQGRTTTVAGVFRRDSREIYAIVIMQPSINRGQGYLKEGSTLWFYDPQSRRFNTSGSADRFQNTNARNSDFTRSTLAEDYKITAAVNEKLGRFNCKILTLDALSSGVTYPKMKIWISEDGLVRQTKDYSLSGQLLRTTAFPEYYQLGSRYVPKRILFVEELRGALINGKFENEKTLITIQKPSFEKLADSVFSKSFLESVNK
jgi:outer membrane lipoprotein-sorting protein